MCGIAGIISKKTINREAIQAMTSSMAHRGPDGSGVWFDSEQKICFGHRRLSILDLSDAGKQPMQKDNKVITFNGEIYNYIEIRDILRGMGCCFETASDTEVILKAYNQWGTDCLNYLNGMFSFAIYDERQNIVFCARDRFGEKPFLFSPHATFIAFASEYKALLCLQEMSSEIDEFRLVKAAHNQSTGLDADRETLFKDIQQLLPSEAMIIDVQTLAIKIWKYWDIHPTDNNSKLSEKDIFEQFRELLIDSVRIRMRSDVPVGSCLSGGLDSSAIVSIVKKIIAPDSDYNTFTGIFPGTPADEWGYAKIVIDDSKVITHVVEPTSEKLANELDSFIWQNELPVGSSSQYAQYNVFRLAKEHGVTVLLDGQGADELLGGYEQYFSQYVKSLEATGQKERLANELPLIKERYPLALSPQWRNFRDSIPFRGRYLMANRLNKGTNTLFGMHYDIAQQLLDTSERPVLPQFSELNGALYQDSFGRYLNTLLRYGDRNSMAHSREVRLPFCDYRLAELALSLPPQYLMGEVQTKRLLRESMKDILPERIRTRWNKQGFRPPQELWFRGNLLKMAKDLFHSQSFVESSYWRADWWQKCINRIEKGETGLGWLIWHPFIAEAWKKYFYEKVKSVEKVSVFKV